MKVAVLGAGGMLGRALTEAFSSYDRIETLGLAHAECDILVPDSLKGLKKSFGPDLVINAAGAPNKNELVNSLGPWYVSRIFDKVWHISTDCVFDSSKKDVHSTIETPIPDTDYGVSKLLGEQTATNVVNIRTSFIGYRHGLLRWLLDQPAGSTVHGWDQAFWSGSTVKHVAEVLAKTVYEKPNLPNVCHLAVAPHHAISKYDLLAKLIRHYKLDLALRRDSTVYCNRMLHPTVYLESIDVALSDEPTDWPLVLPTSELEPVNA